MVTQHGGAIAVDSAPGRGTTFRLTFPRDGAAGAAALATPSRLADTGGDRRGHSGDERPGARRAPHGGTPGAEGDVHVGRAVLGAGGRDVHFLQKPFTTDALLVLVRQALDAEPANPH